MTSDITMIDGPAGPLALRELTGGPASTDTLLIAHANGFHGQCYRAFAQALGKSVRVFAFDFRGHGDSAAPNDLDGFDWSAFTGDVSTAGEYLKGLGIDQVHGFGHSLGGATMIDLEREQPGSFATVFTFEPVVPPPMTFDPNSPLIRSAEGRLRSFPSVAGALMRYAARPPLGYFQADVLFDYVHHGLIEAPDGAMTLKCKPEHEAEIYRRGALTIHLDQMTEVESTVVVGRSGDDGLPAQLAGLLVEKLPNGELVDFPDITHFGPLQDPVGVANAVRERITEM